MREPQSASSNTFTSSAIIAYESPSSLFSLNSVMPNHPDRPCNDGFMKFGLLQGVSRCRTEDLRVKNRHQAVKLKPPAVEFDETDLQKIYVAELEEDG